MSPLFGRRKRSTEPAAGEADDATLADAADDAAALTTGQARHGPYDADAGYPAVQRIDLGALRIPAVVGTSLQVEMDKTTRVARSASVLVGPSRITLTAFAAPRTAGIWDDIRTEIADAVRKAGGTVTDAEGSFGPEVITRIPVTLPDGRQAMRVQRHVGVDGPRWFIRAVFSGPEVVAAAGIATPPGATDDARTTSLEEVLRNCVVVRGPGPRPPREPLPLTVPAAATTQPESPLAHGDGSAAGLGEDGDVSS